MDSDSLACGLLSNRQLTRLASRGGRNRSSTRLPVLGRQLRKRGLAPAPFSISKASFAVSTSRSPRTQQEFPPLANPCMRMLSGSNAYQKNERPLGGAAARAWGWRETQSEGSAVPIVYAALASSRTTHRSKQVTTVVILQKTLITSDYLFSLCSTTSAVDSSPDSFLPVPSSPIPAALCSTEVPAPLSWFVLWIFMLRL